MQNKLTTIIWDWNGTLLNDLEVCVNIINSLLAENNLKPINSAIYQKLFDFPAIRFYEKLGFKFNEAEYQQIADDFLKNYSEVLPSCKLHKDTQKTLKTLAEIGLTQTILSVMQEESLKKAVKAYGIEPYFKYILGSKNNLAQNKFKSSEELMLILKTDPKNICLIGDTLHDMEIAEHIGVKCILISHGHHSLERLQEKKVLVINQLSELTKGLSTLFAL